MPLPIIETPKYETKLPSTGKKIQYRPYLVKEEKMLMIALESGDQKQIIQAVKDTISSCTLGKIDANSMPIFDMEYMFLRIRSKSVGEISKLNLKCVKCENTTKVEVNLDEITIDTKNLPSNKIQLTETVGVVLNWPRVDLIAELSGEDTTESQSSSKLAFDVILSCIDSIYDEKQSYPASEQTKEELNQFIESLNQEQFLKIQKFIEAMPKLQHNVEFDCAHCKEKNSLLLKGIQNFFSSPSLTTVS
jgi:hypothetical protein